jgi:hypothetical protein
MNVAETSDRYVATLRFQNSGAGEIGVAMLKEGPYSAQARLTDAVGGDCQVAANGESWGSLDTAGPAPPSIGPDDAPSFRAIPAGGFAQHTMFFNKMRCASRISASQNLAITASFVLLRGRQRASATVSFDNIELRQ